MPTVYVTVLPTLRSPLKGDSAIDDIVGTTVPTGVTEMLSKLQCEGSCRASNSRVDVLPVAVTVKVYSV